MILGKIIMRVSVNRRGYLRGGRTACMAERSHYVIGSDVVEPNTKTVFTAAKLPREPNREVDVHAAMAADWTCRDLGRV